MSKITVSLYFTVTDLAQASKAFAALHELNLNVQSISAEEGSFYEQGASGLVAAGTVTTTSEQGSAPAENGKTPRGSRDINDAISPDFGAVPEETRYFNVYKNKPREVAFGSSDEAHDAATVDTRQALLRITKYDNGQVSMTLKDVRVNKPAENTVPPKSQRYFNVYADRPSSRGWESRDEADARATVETRKAVLVITRYEDDSVGMELIDTRN